MPRKEVEAGLFGSSSKKEKKAKKAKSETGKKALPTFYQALKDSDPVSQENTKTTLTVLNFHPH